MTEREGSGRRRILAIALAAVVVALIVVVVVSRLGGDSSPSAAPSTSPPTDATPTDEEPTVPETTDPEDGGLTPAPTSSLPIATNQVLPEPMNGQEAIDALGDSLGLVASRNGMTKEELIELLLRDSSAYVSTTGYIVYFDQKRGPA